MSALRFAILGKSPLIAQRCQALTRHPDTQIAKTLSSAQVAELDEAGWSALLDRSVIDAVVLDLPLADAAAITLRALHAGIHVLSEMPGALTVEEIIDLRQAERESSGILKFGTPLRYHSSVRAAADLVRARPYGELLTARAIYGHAGYPGASAREHGILLGHGVQMLDLLHLFCGPFEQVKAMTANGEEAGANLFAMLKSGAGAVAQLHASATSWRQTFRLELGYEQGYVWLDGHLPGMEGYGPEMLIHAQVKRDASGAPLANPDETVTEHTAQQAADLELAEFVSAITGAGPLRGGTSHQAFDAINATHRIAAAADAWN